MPDPTVDLERPLVVGVGNELRRDDGVGRHVVRRLRTDRPSGTDLVEASGDADGLIELWGGRGTVVVVDAVRSPDPPGTLHRWDPERDPWHPPSAPTSSHGLSLGAAVELARSLGRLPRHLVVHGVTIADVEDGAGLSPAVAAAVPLLVERVRFELAGWSPASPDGVSRA